MPIPHGFKLKELRRGVVAGFLHACNHCGDRLLPGEEFWLTVWRERGVLHVNRMHLRCYGPREPVVTRIYYQGFQWTAEVWRGWERSKKPLDGSTEPCEIRFRRGEPVKTGRTVPAMV